MTKVDTLGVFNTCRGMRMVINATTGMQLSVGEVITDGEGQYRVVDIIAGGNANMNQWALGIEEIR